MTVDSIDNAAFSIDHASSNSKVEEINDAPIEQVRLTVPITDDPTLPCLTFRTWFLGITSCALLAFLGQFFGYRQNPLSLSSVSTLPTKSISIPLTNWKFTLNPGPFNMKENVLITIFANTGSSGVYAVNIITIVKAFYHKNLHPMAAMLLTQTTQMLGYGWAGLFRKYLVDSPYMWWPSNLVQVSLFRRPKGGLTRLQFFLAVLVASFSYYVIPGYFFPSITSLSLVCWIWKDSITAQQIGSGLHGLGVGSFAFDWNTVASFLGRPLATPAFAILNILAGFFLIVYVCIPISYWNNIYEAKRFPIYSSHVFTSTGESYNLSRAFNADTFQFDQVGYDAYSPVYLSIFFAFAYGLSFATLTATLSHVALFHGRTNAKMWRQTRAAVHDNIGDVHNRLMRSYEPVPQWWFYTILFIMVSLALIACEGFGRQLQLPYWGILLACALALFFTLPIGIIAATTNQQKETTLSTNTNKEKKSKKDNNFRSMNHQPKILSIIITGRIYHYLIFLWIWIRFINGILLYGRCSGKQKTENITVYVTITSMKIWVSHFYFCLSQVSGGPPGWGDYPGHQYLPGWWWQYLHQSTLLANTNTTCPTGPTSSSKTLSVVDKNRRMGLEKGKS
ncbi:hypothetical protein MKX03_034262 [Papaver bracteatum]|nr:hypothetical protein MKX03_034262 [Papaver bracteatum]